ncbi:hypothetical protein GH825_30720, partial [Bacillus thuringiensis]|nr:hypothetical protein [Bacillus thuringiensis]
KHPTVPPDASQTTEIGREQCVTAGKGDIIAGKATPPIPGKAVPVSSLPKPSPAPTNLPKGWDMRLDKDTGRYFYVNHVTKT